MGGIKGSPGHTSDLLRRSVSRWGVIGQTLAIGPVFSAGFLSGMVAVFAGFNTPLSVLLAAVGTVALAWVLTLYGRRFAGPGVVYEYLGGGVHSSAAIIGGGAYLLGLGFLGCGGGFVAWGYLANLLLATELRLNLGWWVWALVSLAAAVALNYAGVRVGIRAIAVTAAVSVVPFLVIAVAIIARGGDAGNTLAVFDPSQTSWGAVFHGVLFAVALFIGFETVAALGEEARLPRRSVPAAMIVSVVLFAGFYLLVTYAGAIGFGKLAAGSAWFASGNPFGDLGQRYVGRPLGWIVNLAILIDLFSVCVAFTLAGSRVLLALAREGLLPATLARTSRRFRSPAGGLAAVTGWALAVIGWAAAARYGAAAPLPAVLQSVLILSGAGSYLITLVYLLLAVGGLRLLLVRQDRRRLWWQVPAVAAAAAVAVASLDGSLNPFPSYPNDVGAWLAAAGVCAAAAWYGILRAMRRLRQRPTMPAGRGVPGPPAPPTDPSGR